MQHVHCAAGLGKIRMSASMATQLNQAEDELAGYSINHAVLGSACSCATVMLLIAAYP
jgi:hypothetical protein